jgi:DNA helicase-2/ATP-dependent DNA helicase PcrA
MSDASVAQALRSDARTVVVEAPAGCGKTFQAAAYAAEYAPKLGNRRMLILTHTHAACDVISGRAKGAPSVEIRTIDSLIVQVGGAYHKVLGLPQDVSAWARQTDNGYDEVAARVATLMQRSSPIAEALVRRYPVVLCDEHQDSSPNQHAIIHSLREAGARLRIFGDPMQSIFPKKAEFEAVVKQWTDLCEGAEVVDKLEVGHRWRETAPALGEWIQDARKKLKDGDTVDLRGRLPAGLFVFRADNQASGYRLDADERVYVDAFLEGRQPALILAAQNRTVRSLRGVFNRRFPVWEGHTRDALDTLVHEVNRYSGNPRKIAEAALKFLGGVAIGFTSSLDGKILIAEVASGCVKARRHKPGIIQDLARLLLKSPDHRGVAAVLENLERLSREDERFNGIKIDHTLEYHEAIQLAAFATVDLGHAELARRRTFARPRPPPKAISTVHKAKGLECDRVLVLPCDAGHFADRAHHRCLLYVALSRPVRQLALVVPMNKPSPLFLL